MDKTQIMIWKEIGYKAQDIICMADAGFPIEEVKERIDSLRELIEQLDVTELDRVNGEHGIAITEYADMLTEATATLQEPKLLPL